MDLRVKAQLINATLDSVYGTRNWRQGDYSDDLVGALIGTILSQNTSDINSGRAFECLSRTFSSDWDAVRTAHTQEVVDAIRGGGLAKVKASRIQDVLQDIYEREGKTSLEHLRSMSDDDVRKYLTAIHGIGLKTAACILMFNLGRPVIAVDTHVHRVSKRLGLIGAKVSADQAHELLLKLVEPVKAYSVHVHFIEHGRTVCHARRPKCKACPLSTKCNAFHLEQMAGSEAAHEYLA